MEPNQKNFKSCDICGIDATSLCFECEMYFCDSCFKLLHEKQKNNLHKKEKIDYFVPIDIKCPKHPKCLQNLFCIDDKGNYIIYFFYIYPLIFFYRIMLLNLPF